MWVIYHFSCTIVCIIYPHTNVKSILKFIIPKNILTNLPQIHKHTHTHTQNIEKLNCHPASIFILDKRDFFSSQKFLFFILFCQIASFHFFILLTNEQILNSMNGCFVIQKNKTFYRLYA